MIILNDNFSKSYVLIMNRYFSFDYLIKIYIVYWIFNKSVSKICNFSNNFFFIIFIYYNNAKEYGYRIFGQVILIHILYCFYYY